MGSFIIEIIGWIFKSAISDTITWILSSFVLNILIKIPGYRIAILLGRFRSRKKIDREINPDGATSITYGLLFWALIGGIGYRFLQLKK
jgi:hypothetical protein